MCGSLTWVSDRFPRRGRKGVTMKKLARLAIPLGTLAALVAAASASFRFH
jgi:hypothetical protein